MLTPRTVVLVAVIVFTLSILGAVYDVLKTPDSGGLAADSYGTRALGQRGLIETLSELGVSIERRREPPGATNPVGATCLLWAPDRQLVGTEPRHLQALAKWLEQGGRVVVAPARREALDASVVLADALEHFDPEVLPQLGLTDVAIHELGSGDVPPSSQPPEDERGDSSQAREARGAAQEREGNTSLGRRIREAFTPVEIELREVDVHGAGTLAEPASRARRLAVPLSDLHVVDAKEVKADGRIGFTDTLGKDRTLAAAFTRGAGEIIVIGDPLLFDNIALARADNSVLAAHLLADGNRRVLVDEFYHGLSVRGNPFWLLSRPTYAAVAACILLVIGLSTWRQAVLLGPPLTTPDPSRRAIGEYVEAMSRLFARGRRTQRFLLESVSHGALRQLQQECGMHAAKLDVPALAAAMARRAPDRADRLREAAAAVDAALAKGDNCGETEVIEAMRGMSACL
jgi:hypothetical protein